MTTPPRVMVIVAHPDDETFGCGSLLLHAAAAGAHTTVVCATRGEAGNLAPGVPAPNGIAALRDRELHDAAALLGAAVVDVLNVEDSGMSGEPSPKSLCGVPASQLNQAVRDAVARHRPDIVITLDGSDGHRDHQRLRDAVLEVLDTTATTVYLQCLPRSLMHDWVRHHAGVDNATAYTDLPDIGTPDQDITTTIDTTRYLAARIAAIAVHRSQQSPFDGLPQALRERFLCHEYLIRIHPPPPHEPEHTLYGLPTEMPFSL